MSNQLDVEARRMIKKPFPHFLMQENRKCRMWGQIVTRGLVMSKHLFVYLTSTSSSLLMTKPSVKVQPRMLYLSFFLMKTTLLATNSLWGWSVTRTAKENLVMGNQLDLEARGMIRKPFPNFFIEKYEKCSSRGWTSTKNVGLGHEQSLFPACRTCLLPTTQVLATNRPQTLYLSCFSVCNCGISGFSFRFLTSSYFTSHFVIVERKKYSSWWPIVTENSAMSDYILQSGYEDRVFWSFLWLPDRVDCPWPNVRLQFALKVNLWP